MTDQQQRDAEEAEAFWNLFTVIRENYTHAQAKKETVTAYLTAMRAERSRAEAKLALAVEALEEIVGVYYARGEHTYGGYKHQKIARSALERIREKPALTPEQKWAYGAGPGTLAGMRICEI